MLLAPDAAGWRPVGKNSGAAALSPVIFGANRPLLLLLLVVVATPMAGAVVLLLVAAQLLLLEAAGVLLAPQGMLQKGGTM
jgi:hypothetical protein